MMYSSHRLLGAIGLILLRQRHGKAACAGGTRDDGYMVHRVLRGQDVEADRVTGLVVRGQALVVLVDDVALLLHAHYDLEQRLLDLLLRDQLLVAACRKQRCLIEQVFEVCTGETGGCLGDLGELDIRVELLVAGMYLEDSLTALDIRCADIDLTVETARTEQRVIQNILAVGQLR